ncbi:MAG: hypothetical protein IKP40_04430 [Clostridia bacterium]|nr:hypothetical protein [Clostridia bacterium]
MLTVLNRWRTLTVNWWAAGLIMIGLCVLFILGLGVNTADAGRAARLEVERSRVLTERQNEAAQLQKELDYVGSKEDIEHRARTEHSYMKPGETRFHIENMANLHNYTIEESQMRADYMQADLE